MLENLKFVTGGKFISRGKWLHPTRTITTEELIIVTEGEVKMFVSDRRYTAAAGDIIRIMPGEPHGGTEETEDTSFFWIHFSGLPEGEIPPYLSAIGNFERVQLLMREILHYSGTEGYPPECADWLSRVLVTEIARGDVRKDGRKLISDIKEWVKRNRELPTRTSEIAKEFGYNEDYLNRLFKSQCGVGIKKYIDSVRLEGIKHELLIGSRDLSEIAYRFGFSDYKYFLKFFKYHEGTSPSKYREAYYNMHTNSK